MSFFCLGLEVECDNNIKGNTVLHEMKSNRLLQKFTFSHMSGGLHKQHNSQDICPETVRCLSSRPVLDRSSLYCVWQKPGGPGRVSPASAAEQ